MAFSNHNLKTKNYNFKTSDDLTRSFHCSDLRASFFLFSDKVINNFSKVKKYNDSFDRLKKSSHSSSGSSFHVYDFISSHAFLDYGSLLSMFNYLSYLSSLQKYRLDYQFSDFQMARFSNYSSLLEYLESRFHGLIHALVCLSNNRQRQIKRLKDDIGLLFDYCANSFGGWGSNYYFITLTLSDEYMGSHSLETCKDQLIRFVNSYLGLSIANFDYGSDPLHSHRLHLHCISGGFNSFLYDLNSSTLNYEKLLKLYRSWFGSNAILNCEIGSSDFSSRSAVSYYLNKFSNHALKDSTHFERVIYSKKFRKFKHDLNISIKEISLQSANKTDLNNTFYYDQFIRVIDSYDLSNYCGWSNDLSKENKDFMALHYNIYFA